MGQVNVVRKEAVDVSSPLKDAAPPPFPHTHTHTQGGKERPLLCTVLPYSGLCSAAL